MKNSTMTVKTLGNKVDSLAKTVNILSNDVKDLKDGLNSLTVEVRNLAIEMRNGFVSFRTEFDEKFVSFRTEFDEKIDGLALMTARGFQEQNEFMQQKFQEQGEDIYVLRRNYVEMKYDLAEIKTTLSKAVYRPEFQDLDRRVIKLETR
ncbi:MAG: hypothetical protein AAB373_06195 [Patescibacteria group bacterium]